MTPLGKVLRMRKNDLGESAICSYFASSIPDLNLGAIRFGRRAAFSAP
jgi:hypothetical protein